MAAICRAWASLPLEGPRAAHAAVESEGAAVSDRCGVFAAAVEPHPEIRTILEVVAVGAGDGNPAELNAPGGRTEVTQHALRPEETIERIAENYSSLACGLRTGRTIQRSDTEIEPRAA